MISPDSTTAKLQTAEVAPSEVQADEPTFIRFLGAAGLAASLLGVIAIAANEYGPRFVGKSGGYALAIFGFAAMLFHAIRDGDIEFRRAYTWLAYVLLVLFAVTGIMTLAGNESQSFMLRFRGIPILAGAGAIFPVLLGILGLAFLVAPLRHETSNQQRAVSQLVLLLFGGALTLGAVVLGLGNKELLVGPGIVMALLGAGFLAAFFAQAGSNDGLGHFVAVMLGVLGAAALVYALGKSIWPTVLFDGPNAIKNTFQKTDYWKLGARIAMILIALGVAVIGLKSKRSSIITRGLFAAAGLAFAAVFIIGLFSQTVTEAPKAYLVPFGLILALIGLIYMAVSAAHVSESTFVTLTKRELASFFVSPIVYFILFGTAVVAAVGHMEFMEVVVKNDPEEPILQHDYALLSFAAFTVLFMVPALTMRTFSEEKRTGTLEVLLTSPVSEFGIVLSKFLASWLLFILTFLPAMLYLVALRVEGGPFDYRPLLSYLVAIGVCGVAFIGMGLFFSSLTRNQITAAMLTFVGMFIMLLTIMIRNFDSFSPSLQAVFNKFDFLTLWQTSLRGQVSVSQCAAFASLGVFWLFLTTKVLEARKWG